MVTIRINFRVYCVLVLWLVCCLPFWLNPLLVGATTDAPVSTEPLGQVLVRLRPSTQPISTVPPAFLGTTIARRLLQGTKGPLQAAIGEGSLRQNLYLLELKPGLDPQVIANRLALHPDVLYAEPNFVVKTSKLPPDLPRRIPNDFDFGTQYGLQNTNLYFGKPGAEIFATQAWTFTTGSRKVRVAVIDTGIDYYHPDLAANVWINLGEVAGNGKDDDGNGFIDDLHGYDFISHDHDPMDDHFHGTHVAGIIGAVGNNGIGISGVCWEVSLMAIKSFDETGNGTVGGAIEAIDYARRNGAQIINASWGLTEKSRALEDAVQEARAAGILFVAAAGNTHTSALESPANLSGVVAVAALNEANERAFFSNYGSKVTVAAPGQAVLSTTLNGGYDSQSGTSMAAAYVSGVAALVLSLHPEFLRSDLERILSDSLEPVISDQPIGGLINAAQAVAGNPTTPPLSFLSAPPTSIGMIQIQGGATVQQTFEAIVEIGFGSDPTLWQVITNLTLAPTNPAFSISVDSTLLPDGTNTIRVKLTRLLTNGLTQLVGTQFRTDVANTRIHSPQNSDILRFGETHMIHGTAFGPESLFSLEVGEGLVPTQWTTHGITLEPRGPFGWVNTSIASWDTSTLKPDRYYALRLTSSNPGTGRSRTNLAAHLFLDSTLRKSWPVHIDFAGTISEEDWRTAQVSDLDGDGRTEIILVQSGSDTPPSLKVFSSDGSVLWERALPLDGTSADTPVIGNLVGDQKPEILVEAGSQLLAFHGDGKPVAGDWPVKIALGNTGKAIAPVRGDGTNLVVTLSNLAGNRNGKDVVDLCVYDGTGHLFHQWESAVCFATNAVMRQSPAIGDLLPEFPGLEIIVPDGCGGIACYNLAVPSGPIWKSMTPATFLISPVLGDIDGDGELEIVIASARSQNPSSGGLYVFDKHGKKWPHFPVLREESFTTPIALGDIQQNGQLCIAAVGDFTRRVHLIESDGFEAPGWPSEPMENRSVRTSPTLVDVDGNGQADVLVPLPGYPNLANRENNQNLIGGLKAWRADGSPINLHFNPETAVLPFEVNSSAVYHKSSPVIATDLDGNGQLDLIALSINDRSYAIKPQDASLKQRFSIYAWAMPSVFTPKTAPWPSLAQNSQMTGFAPTPPIRPAKAIPNYRFLGQEDQPLSINLQGRFDGELIRCHNGNHGTSIIQSHHTLLYEPATNYSGPELLRIDIRDVAGITNNLAIELLFQPRNDPPQGKTATLTLNKNKSLSIPFSGTDPDADRLTYRITHAPQHGSLMNYPTVANYSPHAGFTGQDFFLYVANDGRADSEPILVKLQVTGTNNLPQTQGFNRTTAVNQSLLFQLIGTDADGDPLISEIIKKPIQGTLVAEGDQWRYTPKFGYSGNDGFDFRFFDGQGFSKSAQANLLITTNNTAPTAIRGSITTTPNVPCIIPFGATDFESNPIDFNITMAPLHGKITQTGRDWFYSPELDYVGPDRFSFTARDGFLTSASETMTIEVSQPNSPPRTRDSIYTITNNLPFSLRVPAEDDQQTTLIATLLKGPKSGRVIGMGLDWVYIANSEFVGTDTFSFKVWDGVSYSNESSIIIHVINPTAPLPLAIESVRLNSVDQSLLMQISVPSLRLIRLQGSVDLDNWQTLQELTPGAHRFDLTVPFPSDPVIFYRLLVP